jgi:hypothetical protein
MLKKIIINCLPYGLIKLLKSIKNSNKNNNICEQIFSDINVVIDEKRKQTVNILFPETIEDKITAGPLSILYFAKFLNDIGLNVRLLFYPKCVYKKQVIANICKLDNEFDDFCKSVEIDYLQILNKKSVNAISISPNDITVATHWTSAFYAKHIQSYCHNKKFIYFIQDDERIFYKNGTEHVLVENTYKMDFYGLFSTEILRQYFLQENIGNICGKNNSSISQESPSYYELPPKENFLKNKSKRRKRFIFYARSGRNCCEYAEYLIKLACQRGIITTDWEIFGLASEKTENIEIGNGLQIHLQKSMPLKLYKESLHIYDVALILMESPHYSMLPIDLALSGCIVVTNTYKIKTKEKLSKISENIIGSDFDIESMLQSIKLAISNSEDLESRYKNAIESNYSTIDNIFNEKHRTWINALLSDKELSRSNI